MEVREFLESLGMDLKKPIAQDIYDGQGIILGEYERFLESQTSMAAAMSLAEKNFFSICLFVLIINR